MEEKLKLKVCGMKNLENIQGLVKVRPDFIGYIFYPKSKRYVGLIPDKRIFEIESQINKVGVFVNTSIDEIMNALKNFNLDFIQLHGDETVELCEQLFHKGVKVIKAFQITEDFDFSILNDYVNVSDYFLFDTKTDSYGGSGRKFNWKVLEKYKLKHPFFLSGGIALEDVEEIIVFRHESLFAIDINSRFEDENGLKKIEQINEFKYSYKSF